LTRLGRRLLLNLLLGLRILLRVGSFVNLSVVNTLKDRLYGRIDENGFR
jgi:hypothetical protein